MKSNLTDKDRLIHIIDSANLILKFCKNKTIEDFKNDEQLRSAVYYQFLIIGEAVNHLNNEIIDNNKYPWHLPRSFRNFIAHEYFGINPERVWGIIDNNLIDFINLINNILDRID